MKAQAICRNDSVVFTISNISFPEIFTQSYRVLADDSVKYTGTFNFTSTQSANSLSYYNPLGKTYRLETRQYPAFIGEDTILSVAIEGCGNSTFSTGFITMFAQDDDQPNVSIDCHKNVGSFDPNDKSANPIGYDDAHLIENTQPVEYTIHFQNLGTYAASFVTVADTLSTDFDITTLKVLGASHDYTVQIFDSTVLKFTFNNINLADAATDSLLSNGFVKFSIKPKENTTIGTEIKNNAFITFDFNDAVETNTVQHEIGKDFLKTSIISLTKNHLYNNIITKIYPNPSTGKFIFEINKELPENVSLHFYSLDGKEIYSKNNLSLQNSISAENWSANIYLFELKTKTELLQSGKIIIQ